MFRSAGTNTVPSEGIDQSQSCIRRKLAGIYRACRNPAAVSADEIVRQNVGRYIICHTIGQQYRLTNIGNLTSAYHARSTLHSAPPNIRPAPLHFPLRSHALGHQSDGAEMSWSRSVLGPKYLDRYDYLLHRTASDHIGLHRTASDHI